VFAQARLLQASQVALDELPLIIQRKAINAANLYHYFITPHYPIFSTPKMSTHPDAHLYGTPRPKHVPKSTIGSSTSHSFASSLSSLIAAPSKKDHTTSARPRPSKPSKDDLFSKPNKGAKKRAAADISQGSLASSEQKHKTDLGTVDYDTLHRSKRKMEEKSRLYAAMKRGDYVPPKKNGINDVEAGPLVDFDRKWAEAEADGKTREYDTTSDDGGDSEEEELIEYTDEFGRTRKGTRAEVAREQRRNRIATSATQELADMSGRPDMPQGVIFGDTIQASAFNPDAAITAAMEELATKRDRSATPPEETHYDATKEVRSKGVGFYQFSRDNDTREKEMQNLAREREETERQEKEREERKEKKRKEIEERKQKIKKKRGEKQVDGFLRSLEGELGGLG
jgi:hypothetical protein